MEEFRVLGLNINAYEVDFFVESCCLNFPCHDVFSIQLLLEVYLESFLLAGDILINKRINISKTKQNMENCIIR